MFRPVFGCALEDHLRVNDREIAFVIEECVLHLLENGLDVEVLTLSSDYVESLSMHFLHLCIKGVLDEKDLYCILSNSSLATSVHLLMPNYRHFQGVILELAAVSTLSEILLHFLTAPSRFSHGKSKLRNGIVSC